VTTQVPDSDRLRDRVGRLVLKSKVVGLSRVHYRKDQTAERTRITVGNRDDGFANLPKIGIAPGDHGKA
jgi:hypothetical protein